MTQEHTNETQAALAYSLEARKQMKAIKVKYIGNESAITQESTLDKMRRLDARVESKAQIKGLVVGILSTLILGTGMSAFMVWNQPLAGISAGIVGIAGIIATFPLYQRVLKQEREKAAPEIIRLSEQA